MFVYAGIDEAGYGPLLGPLTVGRAVIVIPKLDAATGVARPPRLWQRLSGAVCRDIKTRERRGRIPVNDSKRLRTPARPLEHLELGCLAFGYAAGTEAGDIGAWLRAMGETQRHEGDGHDTPEPSRTEVPNAGPGISSSLPWYRGEGDDGMVWASLPRSLTAGEVAVARSLLTTTLERIGVEVGSLAVSIVPEDRFNEELTTVHSKAAVSFRRVGGHLRAIWNRWGEYHPLVVVDRQGGRTTYGGLLARVFGEAEAELGEGVEVTVLSERAEASVYEVGTAGGSKRMTVRFEVEAEGGHLPVALASMLAKYTRELVMERFNAHFTATWPELKPTAGYGSDAKRWLAQAGPRLGEVGLTQAAVRRRA